jgi:hypothetical protein
VCAWNSRPPFLIDSSVGRDYYGIAADRATRMLMSRKLLWRAPFSPRRARNHRATDSDGIWFALTPRLGRASADCADYLGSFSTPKFVPDPTSAATGDFTFYNWMNEWVTEIALVLARRAMVNLIDRSWILHFTHKFHQCKTFSRPIGLIYWGSLPDTHLFLKIHISLKFYDELFYYLHLLF